MVMCTGCGQYNDVPRAMVPFARQVPIREPAKPWWNTPLALVVPLLVFGAILWFSGQLWMFLVLIAVVAVWSFFSD